MMVRTPEETLLFARSKSVRFPTGCLIWTGKVGSAGYPVIKVGGRGGRRWYLHRLVVSILSGLDDRDVGHTCHDRSNCPGGVTCLHRRCWEPDHLKLQTRRENLLASQSTIAARNAGKTRCPKGHPYDEANTMRSGHHRHCRECKRLRRKKA